MPVYRVVSRSETGEIVQRDYKDLRSLVKDFHQIGVEEDSYTMRLHGEPVFRGLIGPLSEGKTIVRYETPDVYATLTEKWASARRNGLHAASDE